MLTLSFTAFLAAHAKPFVEVQGSCPGALTISGSGFTPGQQLAIVSSRGPGSALIPGGPCVGGQLLLAQQGLKLRRLVAADPSGEVSLSLTAPQQVCPALLQAVDVASCTTSNAVDLTPHDWVLAAYAGESPVFDPSVRYEGLISCRDTCASEGMLATGVRVVCNLWGNPAQEGCDAFNDGMYSNEACGLLYEDGVRQTHGDNIDDCIYPIEDCIDNCTDAMTYHALECACQPRQLSATDVDLGAADATLFGEDAGDNAASRVSAGDIDGDGIDEVLVTSQFNDRGGAGAGITYIVHSPVGNVSLASATALVGDPSHASGYVTGVGDLDGDGFGDMLISAVNGDALGRTDAGEVYLVHGPVPATTSVSSAATATFIGALQSSMVQHAVVAGDLDQDGVADLAISAPTEPTGCRSGSTYIASTDATGEVDLALATTIITGSTCDDRFGMVADVGDLDSDGVPDLAIGAPKADGAETSAGAVYVFTGPLSGALLDSDAVARYEGAERFADLGEAFGAPVDYDGDGLNDVVVAAPQALGTGAVYVIHSPPPASGSIDAVASAVIQGTDLAGEAGTMVEPVGDVNGDGLDDLLIGAPFSDALFNGGGMAYLVLGGQAGVRSVADAAITFQPTGPNDLAGIAGTPANLDGDGIPDLVIGSQGRGGRGAAQVVLGRSL